jgi:hypothetical protein
MSGAKRDIIGRDICDNAARERPTVDAGPACQAPTIHPQFERSTFGGFMTSICTRHFQFGLMLATALSVSMFSTASLAYTPEQQQACSGDAFQFCGPEIPDVDRVTVCMIRNKSRLSPGCRVFFRPDPEPSEAAAGPAGKPISINPATARKPVSAKAKKPKKPAKPDES